MENEIYVLHVTKKCNMKCLYCYENDKTSEYSWDEIKSFIDDMINYRTNDQFTIEFLGGEPMLEWNHIQKSYEYIETNFPYLNVDYIITTNGTIMNDHIIRYLQDNKKIQISISLDGHKWSNQLRVKKNNENSYDEVVSNIGLLIENNINPSVHITTHNYNVAFLNESIFHLYKDLSIKHIGVGTIESTIEIDNLYCEEFLKQLDQVSKRIVDDDIEDLKIDLFEGIKPKEDIRTYIRDETGKVIGESYGRSGDDISNKNELYNINKSQNDTYKSNLIYSIRKRAFLNHQLNLTSKEKEKNGTFEQKI